VLTQITFLRYSNASHVSSSSCAVSAACDANHRRSATTNWVALSSSDRNTPAYCPELMHQPGQLDLQRLLLPSFAAAHAAPCRS